MKNKSIFIGLTALFLMLFAGSAMAQKAEFGLRLMPTFANFDIKSASGSNVDAQVRLGMGFGAMLGIQLSEHLSVQGEVIYSAVSQKYQEDNADRRVNLKYVNVPLLLSLNTGKTNAVNLSIVAGPQIGINVGSNLLVSGSNSGDNSILTVKRTDIGFAYGAGLDFGINYDHTIRLGLGYRGVLGLLDISNNSGTATTDNYYLLDRTHLKTNAAYIGLSMLF